MTSHLGNSVFVTHWLRRRRGAAAVGEAILATVREHASGRSQFDDITLVCFSRSAEIGS